MNVAGKTGDPMAVIHQPAHDGLTQKPAATVYV